MKNADQLVETLRSEGIDNPRILEAFRAVPRDRFVLPEDHELAWEDMALPIGDGQTISQPFVIALGFIALELRPESRALEIGTGSGYQAALLAQLCGEVFTVELLGSLAKSAERRLAELGLSARAHVRTGDGWWGWPEKAPFDAIVVSAAVARTPEPLLEQLAEGGRLVAPVGGHGSQDLVCVRKTHGSAFRSRSLIPVRFVPFVRPPG